MFRFWGANAALAELVVTSAILAATVGNINAQEAFQPYSVELLDSKNTYGLKNCSDSTGCGPGPGEGDMERFAKFKKHFKKKADKTAKVCDVIVYGCPSSKFLRQRAGQIKGGSGSLVDDVTRLAVGAASGVGRWCGV
jgi:hypothetical protein